MRAGKGSSRVGGGTRTGHRNIASTRIYLHLADTWLSTQYHQAVTALDSSLTDAQTGGEA